MIPNHIIADIRHQYCHPISSWGRRVVGTTMIPLLLRAGFKPAAAAAAVLMGTTGSLLSPGLSHNAYVSDMAHMTIMELISYHGKFSLMIGVVGAIGLSLFAGSSATTRAKKHQSKH